MARLTIVCPRRGSIARNAASTTAGSSRPFVHRVQRMVLRSVALYTRDVSLQWEHLGAAEPGRCLRTAFTDGDPRFRLAMELRRAVRRATSFEGVQISGTGIASAGVEAVAGRSPRSDPSHGLCLWNLGRRGACQSPRPPSSRYFRRKRERKGRRSRFTPDLAVAIAHRALLAADAEVTSAGAPAAPLSKPPQRQHLQAPPAGSNRTEGAPGIRQDGRQTATRLAIVDGRIGTVFGRSPRAAPGRRPGHPACTAASPGRLPRG